VAIAAANTGTGKFLWRCRSAATSRSFPGWCSTTKFSTANGPPATTTTPGSPQSIWQPDRSGGAPTRFTRVRRCRMLLPQSALDGVDVKVGEPPGAEGSRATIVAINLADGKVRWTRTVTQPGEGIALDQAVLAVTTGTAEGAGGTVTGLDRDRSGSLDTPATCRGRRLDDDRRRQRPCLRDLLRPRSFTTLAFAARTGTTLWNHDGRASRPSRPSGRVVALETTEGSTEAPTASGLVGLNSDTRMPSALNIASARAHQDAPGPHLQ
jgi:outer membrane protein assembly factor BamB